MENPLAHDLDSILERTRELWEELRGERIFITGGTGFFGCWLLESFAWANDKLNLNAEAVVLTRNPEAFKARAPHIATNSSIRLLSGDVRTFAFPELRCGYIVHGATESASEMNDEDPAGMVDVAVNGTKRVLECATKIRSEKLLLLSSGAVYGKQPESMPTIPEDYLGGPDTTQPGSAYAEAKRVMELLCSIYARDTQTEVKFARGFAFVGPYFPLDSHFAVGNFIQDALLGGPIKIKGTGAPYRSYMYGTDLAVWLWTILFKGVGGRTYNVGSDQAVTILELARIIASMFHPTPEVLVFNHIANEPMNRYIPNIMRAKDELGLTINMDLPQAVKSTIEWYTVQSATRNSAYNERPSQSSVFRSDHDYTQRPQTLFHL